jgi:hypothetical protein
MVLVDDILVSLDIFREKFLCDLALCKGECCVEGDAGAPVEKEELAQLEKVLPIVWDDLSVQARELLSRQGVCYTDGEGDLVTSIVDGKDCVFTCYDAGAHCRCAIEKAFLAGKTDFYKPISCHLYPIRISETGIYKAINYHRWGICRTAVLLGEKENLPVYRFLKEPLIRRFGASWYAQLELVARELENYKGQGTE